MVGDVILLKLGMEFFTILRIKLEILIEIKNIENCPCQLQTRAVQNRTKPHQFVLNVTAIRQSGLSTRRNMFALPPLTQTLVHVQPSIKKYTRTEKQKEETG